MISSFQKTYVRNRQTVFRHIDFIKDTYTIPFDTLEQINVARAVAWIESNNMGAQFKVDYESTRNGKKAGHKHEVSSRSSWFGFGKKS